MVDERSIHRRRERTETESQNYYKIQTGNPELRRYLQTSAKYGLLLYSIYEQGWIIMLKGYEGDMNGQYDTKSIRKAIDNYDRLWKEYKLFGET